MRASRFHQVVLIWVRDAQGFAEYQRCVGPLVERHEGAVDGTFAPSAIRGGLPRPAVVNLVHSPSRAAYDAFMADPEFAPLRALRRRRAPGALPWIDAVLHAASPGAAPALAEAVR